MAAEIPTALINKYRPADFTEVVGHTELLGSLQRALTSPTCPHSFLLTGPAGTGKTTLSRIIAKTLDAEIVEIDAASNSGIDSARQLVEMSQYGAMTATGRRMFIIDECHGLSKQAMDALLKTIEEPPAYLYFALCTTAVHKVSETMKSRCFHMQLKALSIREIEELLETVCLCEGWEVAPDVMQAVVVASTGQPRKALSLLQALHDVKTKEEVRRIISLTEQSDGLLEILRSFVSGRTLSWPQMKKALEALEDEDFEGILETASGYLTAAFRRAETEQQAERAWLILDAFTRPLAVYNKKAAFYVAIGRVMAMKGY